MIELVQKNEVSLAPIFARLLEGFEHIGLHKIRHRCPGLGGTNLDRSKKVRRVDDRTTVEKHELQTQRIGDRTGKDCLSAALRTV